MPLSRPYRYKWRYFKSIGYTPRSGQKLLHWAADYYRYIGFFAYPRGGKSYGAAMEVAATVNEPDYHCWIVAPTYELGSKEFGYIYQAHLTSGHLVKASHVAFNVKGGDMTIEYPWGWWVTVKSGERPHLILAEEVDELILAEGPRLPESLWHRSLYNRVEKRRGRTYIPATPMGQNWVKTEFYDRAQKEIDGQRNPEYSREHWALRVTHLEEERGVPGVHYQGGVYEKDTIETAQRRSPRLAREQFGGDFISYAGTVYDGMKAKKVAPFEIPLDWHVVIGYDHGASGRRGGMTAIPFIAWDNERPRNAYIYKLIYAAGHGASWYIAEIQKRLTVPGMSECRPYDIIVVDPSAKQVRIELMNAGLVNTTPKVHDFKARFSKVTDLLDAGRLYVFDTPELKPWWHEIARYEWKEGAKGEPRGDSVQGPDDAMDGTGYGLLYEVPAVTDEEIESAAMIRSELVKSPGTRLTENEKRAWKRVREQRLEQEEPESVYVESDDTAMVMEDFFEEE